MTGGSVLLAGDWHGSQHHARWTVDRAVKLGADRVLQLGDFGFWEHEPSGVEFLDKLEIHATRRSVTVHFIDGNHDKTGLLLETYSDRDDDGFILVRPHIRYAPRGHRWSWDAVRFIALGGAYSVDKAPRLHMEAAKAEKIREQNAYRPVERQRSVDTSGTLWFPEEEMSDADLDGFLADGTPVDVIVSHDKPRAAKPAWNRKDYPACYPNQDRLQRAATALQPALVAHGHLHFRYTDRVMIGDDRWCRVEGLDADLEASTSGKRLDSTLLLPLDAPPTRD